MDCPVPPAPKLNKFTHGQLSTAFVRLSATTAGFKDQACRSLYWPFSSLYSKPEVWIYAALLCSTAWLDIPTPTRSILDPELWRCFHILDTRWYRWTQWCPFFTVVIRYYNNCISCTHTNILQMLMSVPLTTEDVNMTVSIQWEVSSAGVLVDMLCNQMD